MTAYNYPSFASDSSPLLADFVDSLYRPWAITNKRSFAQSDAVYLKPILESFGQYHLHEITIFQIEPYKRKRIETPTIHGRKRKPASVNREIECLCRILSYAVECGILAASPAKHLRKLREDNERYRYLTRNEEHDLMTALAQAPLYLQVMVILAIETGMRRGELLDLDWAQVDFNSQTVYVKRTKSGKPRVIPLSDRAIAALGRLAKTSGPVFGRVCFKRSWGTALKRAEIKDFRFHDLRHTAATRWAERGADVFTIAALLGHRCIQTTMRYAHSSVERMREIINRRE